LEHDPNGFGTSWSYVLIVPPSVENRRTAFHVPVPRPVRPGNAVTKISPSSERPPEVRARSQEGRSIISGLVS
jgi:hypothetical protein